MTAREYLEQVCEMDKRINAKCDELCHLKALCEKVTTTMSDMPKGGNDKEDAYIQLAEARDEINADIDRLAEVKEEVRAAIGVMEDKLLRDLLVHRYIDCLEWAQVAAKIGRTVDMTRKKLHYEALAQFQSQYIDQIVDW